MASISNKFIPFLSPPYPFTGLSSFSTNRQGPGDSSPIESAPEADAGSLNSPLPADGLWISISGDVYDVTPWLPHHTGGDLPLITLAGQDATDAFAAYHPPSARPILRRFFVGRLFDYTVSPTSADYCRLLAQLSSAGLFDRVGPVPKLQLALMAVLFCAALYLVLACATAEAHLLAGARSELLLVLAVAPAFLLLLLLLGLL